MNDFNLNINNTEFSESAYQMDTKTRKKKKKKLKKEKKLKKKRKKLRQKG